MTVSIKPLTLPIQGMTCASCVAHASAQLRERPLSRLLVARYGTTWNLAQLGTGTRSWWFALAACIRSLLSHDNAAERLKEQLFISFGPLLATPARR
jgi:hypothetical protein